MNKQQKKVSIDFNIKAAHISLEKAVDLVVIWKRGEKTIDTRVKTYIPGDTSVVFNEKFQMKTVLDYDSFRKQFVKKKSDLQLWKSDMSSQLGTADFDLSKYANEERGQEDKLPLKNCLADPKAYIEIYIKAKVEGGLNQPNTPTSAGMRGLNSSMMLRMPTIEERESEGDVKEELERKEKDLQKRIAKLENDLNFLINSKETQQAIYDEMSKKLVK